jgi:hypothetical protein
MADRYWVGGTANWDGTAGTKWATASGGAGGASVPTSADDVFFTNLSTGTCTISTGNTGAKSINCTGFTGTLAGSSAITVSGSITLVAGMTVTYSGTLTLNATATLTTAGKTIGPLTINGAGITVTLGDALTSSGAITVTQGTFTTANFNVTAASFQSSNVNLRTINLGSSTVTLSLNIDFANATNLTFNAGTSQIIFTAASAFNSCGNQTFYNVSYTSTGANTHSIGGLATYNNLSITAPSSAGVRQITFDSRQTINGTLSTTGTAGNRRVWFRGVTYGLAQTLTINSAPSLTDADFRDIYVIGTAAPISGTRVGDLRGCRGITFSTPKTVYWNLAGSNNWSANGWSDTSTGTPSTDFFPLAQDTATFTNAGEVSQVVMNSAVPYTGTVDMSSRTTAMNLTINGFTIYGDWKNGSGTALSGSSELTFSGRNTQTITSAGKTFWNIVIDTLGGTVQLADALSIFTPPNFRLFINNGTFDTKNFNVTAAGLVSNNSNVRTIKLGSSTVTLTLGNFPNPTISLDSTNLTFDAGTSTIVSSADAPQLNLANQTFYNLSFTSAFVNSITITGSNIFNNLSVTAPSSAGLTVLPLSANQTITGTLTVAGASPVRRIFVCSNTLGTTRTLSVGTLSATDCDFRDIAITGAAAGSSLARAGNCGGNSGITFPAAKTVYWNLAGTQNWSATAWAPSSGGTPNINNFPLAQDTAVFDNTGGAGTVTIERAWNIGAFDASARTSAMTLNVTGGVLPRIHGDWKHGNISSSTTSKITFSKRGSQTITSNGNAFSCNVYIDSINGTVLLADAITLNGGNTELALESGTFDAVTFNVTTRVFISSFSATRTLKMGTGLWTLTAAQGNNVWNVNTSLTLIKGTANILLSANTTDSRTFIGGFKSYNKLTIGGTTGTSTTTIITNNQFTELASTKTVAHTIALGTTNQTFGKWTVTGTVGNVVTLTGTGTSHVLAGACTSGIDYLAMGSIGFAATSLGEFYAGANSTGTAAAPVYRTAKPADSTRYWVGGTGNWSDTARWSTVSGGASGASVPRSHDDVVFDSLSNTTAYTATVNAVTGGIRMKSLTIAGPASGNVTLAGSTAIDGIYGNVTLPATGLTRTYTGAITLSGSTSGLTLTTNGVALSSSLGINGVGCEWTLGSALNNSAAAVSVANGTFNCNTYNLTAGSFSSDNENPRNVNFGSGTITLSLATAFSFGTSEISRANLTFASGTAQINCSNASPTFFGNNQTFYNVAFTSTSTGTVTLNGTNSFNNLSFTGITSAVFKNIVLAANQTVTGTLTFSAGTDATMRHFCRSDTIGTTRTITAAAVSMTDVDFCDITIAGAAAPASGTRIGNCKGNSGITFTAPKTVYWVGPSDFVSWNGNYWATMSGGTANLVNFPLAQDTAIIDNNSGGEAVIASGTSYNIGTFDASARTNSSLTIAPQFTIHGDWITSSRISYTSSSINVTFAGRTTQSIRTSGVPFSTFGVIINSPGGSVVLQDALSIGTVGSSGITLTAGTLNCNGYNVSFTSGNFTSTGDVARTINIGSGTFSIFTQIGGTRWNITGSNVSVIGNGGTIQLSTASFAFTTNTFAGNNLDYSNINLKFGNTGPIVVTGNNIFNELIIEGGGLNNGGGGGVIYLTGNNTFTRISSNLSGLKALSLGNTTQKVGTFTATGIDSSRALTITGTSATSPATLILTGLGPVSSDFLTITGIRAYPPTDKWYAGTNSTNNGTLGWTFKTPPVSVITSFGNFLMFYN